MNEFVVGEKVKPKTFFGSVSPISAKDVNDKKGLIQNGTVLTIKSARRNKEGELIIKFCQSNYEYEAVFFESAREVELHPTPAE